MADRFYTPTPLPSGELALDGPEGHHLVAVRRFAPGDRVVLFNGDGHDYPAEVVAVAKKSAVLNVFAPVAVNRELATPLTVASALPKGDRADFLVEKLTELGVTRFVPLITTRSVVIPKAGVVEKFTRAVVEASKQCGRNVLMHVNPPCRWEELVRKTERPAHRYLLHTTDATEPLPATVSSEGGLVAVGPEGGWTEGEVAAGRHHGWKSFSLGPRILRVETAAIAAVARLTAV